MSHIESRLQKLSLSPQGADTNILAKISYRHQRHWNMYWHRLVTAANHAIILTPFSVYHSYLPRSWDDSGRFITFYFFKRINLLKIGLWLDAKIKNVIECTNLNNFSIQHDLVCGSWLGRINQTDVRSKNNNLWTVRQFVCSIQKSYFRFHKVNTVVKKPLMTTQIMPEYSQYGR